MRELVIVLCLYFCFFHWWFAGNLKTVEILFLWFSYKHLTDI